MSTTVATRRRCVLCGKSRPTLPKLREHWRTREGRSLTGAPLTVDVCPSCRTGKRDNSGANHDIGTCSGDYRGPAYWVATCDEPGCDGTWSCWQQECVEGWANEHYEDDCDCWRCVGGHHDSTIRESSKSVTP